ncbi:hypothetical protein BJ165DRAFT_321138 [Panaeolus papilionaceus]|nr:hypothetical protein BJ165DRAFT_321138 [Panaeolus papilionaceus]
MAALSFEHKQMVSGNSRWLLNPSLSQLHAQIQSTMSTYEIYDDILRYVLEFVANSGKDNLQTLAAFRAASKRTAPLADPLFFRDIKIMLSDERGREDQETSERRLKNFYEALEGNPEICRFITRFTIKTILKEDSQPSQHWIRTNVHLPLILSHLKHLTHFSLVNRWHPMAWPDVNTNLFKAFQDINQLPELSYLEFFRIGGFPSGWITTFENLETLKLIDVVLDAQYSIHMSQHSTPQLKDLEISSGAFGVGGFGIHNQLWTDLTGVTPTVERLKIVNDAGDAFVVLASPIFSTFVRFPLLKELEVVVPDLRTRGKYTNSAIKAWC